MGGPTLLRGALTVGNGNVTALMSVDSGGTADAVLSIGPAYASIPARSFQIVSKAGGQSVQVRRGGTPILAVNADGSMGVLSLADMLIASYSSAGEIVFNSTVRLLGDMQMGPKPESSGDSGPVKSISIAVRVPPFHPRVCVWGGGGGGLCLDAGAVKPIFHAVRRSPRPVAFRRQVQASGPGRPVPICRSTEGPNLPPSSPNPFFALSQNGRVTGGVSLVLSGDSTGVVPAGVNPGDVFLVSGGGGSVRLTSGSTTNSSAGTFLINPGDTATAGSVSLMSGASNASVAGSVTIQTADAAQGTGGVVNVVSGAGISGGSVVITAGTSLAGADGGSALQSATLLGPGAVVQSGGGEGSTAQGFRRRLLSAAPPPPSPYADNSGGSLMLSAGAAHSARGGGVAITAGRSIAGAGGSVVIAPGAAPNASGTVRLQDAAVRFPPSSPPPASPFPPIPFSSAAVCDFSDPPFASAPRFSLPPPPPVPPSRARTAWW